MLAGSLLHVSSDVPMLHVVLQISALLPLLIGDDGAPAWVCTEDWPVSTVARVPGLAVCLNAIGGALTGLLGLLPCGLLPRVPRTMAGMTCKSRALASTSLLPGYSRAG